MNKTSILLLAVTALLVVSCQDEDPTPDQKEIMHVSFTEPLTVYYNHPVEVDMNGDSISDYRFTVGLEYSGGAVHTIFMVNSMRENKVKLLENSAMAYEKDVHLGEDNDLNNVLWSINSGELLIRTDAENQPSEWSGAWDANPDGYLAVSIKIGETWHYGWIRLVADPENDLIMITDYAYHQAVGEPIKSGQTER